MDDPSDIIRDQNKLKIRQRIAKIKQSMDIDTNTIEDAWERLQHHLDLELRNIQELDGEIIPEMNFDQIISNGGQIPSDIANEVYKRGILIVRSVLSREDADNCHRQLTDYMESNGEDPKAVEKTFYDVYWSKAQVNARQHSNIIATQKALLHLWKKDCDTIVQNQDAEGNGQKTSDQDQMLFLDHSVNLDQPLTYVDRFRFRKPGDNKFDLPPHLDSGSITRWSDPLYRNAYRKIFGGRWEEHDPFLVGGRGVCTMDEHCSFFRAFQGWTSLSEAGPGEGTLRVLPLTKESIAYLLMRPFLKDMVNDELPGYEEGKLFFLDPSLHAKLYNSLISIPKVNPGDTVWWHPDLIHSVDVAHNGSKTNSVLYIPVGPDCPMNRLYVERMRFRFLSGLAPPDFEKKPENEKSFAGRANYAELSLDGKKMMGFY